MPDPLPLSIQLSWLIPLYGFSGMVLSLPWAAGWVKRNGPRPAAYLNLLVTLLAVLHGSLVLRAVLALGPRHLEHRLVRGGGSGSAHRLRSLPHQPGGPGAGHLS